MKSAEVRSDSGVLADLNERWAGARCRIRFDVPFKKGRDGKGWSKSVWIVPRTEGRKGLGGAYLSVSDRDSMLSPIPASTTPEGFQIPGGPGVVRGTAFIADGWEYENPKKRSGLLLRLRLAKGAGEARVSFRGKFGGNLGRQRVEEAESWARIELFKLAAADERLVDAPAPAAVSSPAPSAIAPSATPVGAPLSADSTMSGEASIELRVLGVAVEPLRVAPGGQVALVVTYSVPGVAGGPVVSVLERRTIARPEETLTTLETTVSRLPGTHESRQPLRVPSDLAQGIYELRVSLQANGAIAQGSAIFQVTGPDG